MAVAKAILLSAANALLLLGANVLSVLVPASRKSFQQADCKTQNEIISRLKKGGPNSVQINQKGPYVHESLLKKIEAMNASNDKKL